ncbi:MAG: aminotransferase class III-fold pyridoxal phosphate-dependent enzyme [Candidatus Thermoplasmatota archaeon]
MNIEKMKEALIYDKVKNPERTNATFERLEEILQNTLGGQAEKIIKKIKEETPIEKKWEILTEKKAEKITNILDEIGLKPQKLEEIIKQLQYSEISSSEALALHKKYKIPVSKLEKDIIPVKGDGAWIMDTKGRWYLDMDSNYSATNLGMDNEELAQGLYNQAKLLVSMKEDRVQIARTRFLKEISTIMPKGLDFFYWQNSGGEAVDKAIKIAKAYTDTEDVIAFKNGFHGRTHGAVAVTWNEKYRKPFHLAKEKWVHFADFNDIDSVKQKIEETDAKIIILEIVQGEEAGNKPADPEFIKKLWKIADENDAVIIDDEVQAGFGRTALHKDDWFACDSYNVVPDIMAIGKSFGGGYPVTAVVTTEEISDSMQPGYDGSTFGGNPMAMTSSLIATRQMKRKNITENVIERSKQIKKGLQKLQQKFDFMDNLRVTGLMIGFSLSSEENVEKTQKYLRKNGVKSSLSTGKYIRFLPPTIISKGEVKRFLQALEKSLEEI